MAKKEKEKDPAFLLYSKDWIEGTAELLPAEKGVYIDLLCHQHQKGDLPADTVRLSRIAGLSHDEFMKIWPGISDKFEPNGNRLVNRKLTEVMTERSERGRKNTIIGTFASLLRTGKFTPAQHQFLKKSFRVDEFLTESDQTITERLTEWLQQRLKSIEDEDGNEDEDEDEDENENSFGKFENLFFGNIPEDLIELAGQLKPTEKAGEWHDYVQGKIERLGYQTRREVPCKFPDGRDGRIDLVAERDGIQVAIELDYRTPRKKSVLKVQTYPRGMVLLRDPIIVRKENVSRVTTGSKPETIDFTQPDVEGDEIIFPIDTQPMRDLWAKWKRYRWEQYGQRYGMMGEQADLKRLERMTYPEIHSTILTAIANKWKNLYPEHSKNKANGTAGTNKKQQHTSTVAQYVTDHYAAKLRGG